MIKIEFSTFFYIILFWNSNSMSISERVRQVPKSSSSIIS